MSEQTSSFSSQIKAEWSATDAGAWLRQEAAALDLVVLVQQKNRPGIRVLLAEMANRMDWLLDSKGGS